MSERINIKLKCFTLRSGSTNDHNKWTHSGDSTQGGQINNIQKIIPIKPHFSGHQEISVALSVARVLERVMSVAVPRGVHWSERGMRGSERVMRGSERGMRESERGVRGSDRGERGTCD